ncbi:aldose epimerase family protein [Hyphococcus lacteus]|uniref:Aldose 1-epimerase n=1 Tax=Hyphococcus lacteus TaxID=3143536 RepID=A0ABV3Z691_9PROT
MIEISAQDTRIQIAPEFGCAVTQFQFGERNILRGTSSLSAVANDPREAACFPCVPWFGRLTEPLVSGTKQYAIKSNLPVCDDQFAIHGDGWVNAWVPSVVDESALTCTYLHQPTRGNYPFKYSAQQRFCATPAGLEISLGVRNESMNAIPVGLGLHPFFLRTATTRLTVSADEIWTPPSHDQPGDQRPTEPSTDFRQTNVLPDSGIDHTLLGWDGIARIENSGGVTTLRSDAPYLHLYAPIGQGYFCLEPITQLPGKFGNRLLNTGEDHVLTLSIEYTPN